MGKNSYYGGDEIINKKGNDADRKKESFADDYIKMGGKEKNIVLFENKRRNLISKFFLFFIFVLFFTIGLCLFFRTIGYLPLMIAIFFIYSRVSMNNDRWEENYNLIKSNKWGNLFYKFMNLFAICFFIILFYVSMKHTYGFEIGFMELILKYLIYLDNWLKLI